MNKLTALLLCGALLTSSCAHAKPSTLEPVSPTFNFNVDVDGSSGADLSFFLEKHAGQDVQINWHSPGGSVFAGWEIIAMIEAHKGNVTCKVDMLAASMAAAIYQSCDVRIMTRRSLLMMHGPSVAMRGKAGDFAEQAAVLRQLTIALFAQYTLKNGMDPIAFAEAVGDRDLWLNAFQAVELGFADRVE